jgi:hypothetical protein
MSAEYTLWDTATGEILEVGSSSVPQNRAGDGQAVHIGAQLSADFFRFNVETGEPYEFVRQLTQQELTVAINRERGRRIEAGKVIDGVYVTGRDEDARNLTNLALAAQMRLAAGDTSTATLFRDGNNVDHELTPPQVLALWQQSAAYVSALYAASWALKAMDPIPQNVAANEYWQGDPE